MNKELVIAFSILIVYSLISIGVVLSYPLLGESEWTVFGTTQYAAYWLKGGVAASGLFMGSLIGLINDRKSRILMVFVGAWLGGFDIIMYIATNDQYGVKSYYWNLAALTVALTYIYIKLRDK